MGTLPKNDANLSESMVADVTMSFKSVRRDTTWQERANKSEVLAWHYRVFVS